MYFSERIKLRTSIWAQDESGNDYVAEWIDREVWADVQSVRRDEFYRANRSDINAVIDFKIHREDYRGEMDVLYKGKHYEAIRSYALGEGVVDLPCQDKAV